MAVLRGSSRCSTATFAPRTFGGAFCGCGVFCGLGGEEKGIRSLELVRGSCCFGKSTCQQLVGLTFIQVGGYLYNTNKLCVSGKTTLDVLHPVSLAPFLGLWSRRTRRTKGRESRQSSLLPQRTIPVDPLMCQTMVSPSYT